MTDGFNLGVPLGAVIVSSIVGPDSQILNIATSIAGAIAGSTIYSAACNINRWAERESERQSEYGPER